MDNVTIDLMGFTLNGNNTYFFGIVLDGTENIVIFNGTIRDFRSRGINATGIKHIKVSAVNIMNNGSTGIFATAGSTSMNIIEKCNISNNGSDGIEVVGASIIRDNTLSYNGGHGLRIDGGNIINNNIIGNTKNGIYLSFYHNVQKVNQLRGNSIVRGNTINENGRKGLYGGGGNLVENNVIDFNKLSGIRLTRSNIIKNNVITFNNDDNAGGEGGIIIDIHNLVHNNAINYNYRTGLLIEGGNNIIEHNSVIGGSGAINGVTFNAASNYYAHNRVGGHPNLQYNLSNPTQINGGDNIQF